MKSLISAALAALFLLPIGQAKAQSEEDLAKKLANPFASLIRALSD